jgi:quercetin dioxygenase-like cupin family protein
MNLTALRRSAAHKGQWSNVFFGVFQMPVFRHDELPIREVPRIRTRVLVGPAGGAESTAVWEQWIEPDGFIPLHYHEVEEVLLILDGEIELTIDGQKSHVCAPATVVAPKRVIHGLKPCGSSPVHLLAFFPDASPQIFAPDGRLRPLPWNDVGGGDEP